MALARALINEPRVLLLDEPLGALDLKLREQMQAELKALQRKLGITFLFVTHDQHEALSMSDRVGVFNQGRLEQVGTPHELYDAPATRFVAEFVGAANLLRRRRRAAPGRQRRRRCSGPSASAWARRAARSASGIGRRSQYFGSFCRLRVARQGCHQPGRGPGRGRGARRRRRAQTVHLHWDATRCMPLADAARRSMTAMALRSPPWRRCTPRRRRPAVGRCSTGAAACCWLLLLVPPLLWFGVVYVGSLLALLANSFFRLDDFTGPGGARARAGQLRRPASKPANLDVVLRTVAMALRWSRWRASCSAFRWPTTWRAMRAARRRPLLYVAVMLPLWSSYLVRLYAWKLLLAKEGAISWAARRSCTSGWVLDGLLAHAGDRRATRCSFSPLGTFIVFVYIWLPFMILPIQAALERMPGSLRGGLGRPRRARRRRRSAA